MSFSEDFQVKLEALPGSSGCYIFRDRRGEVLYVGKAKSLRSRVRSYFQDTGDTRAFIPFLRKTVADFETIVTSNEKEAAILENSLIKEHRPRYNVKLRDDKEFLSLRLSMDHAWPRLELVRKPKSDEARYFGPYHSATAARRTLQLVEKHFQLRTCSDRELVSRKRPCLKYQIKRCPAPCVYDVDRDMYIGQVQAVALFLEGRHDELTRELRTRMDVASEGFEFELAALYRDQIRAVESVREAQRVVSVTGSDQDVLGLYREGDLVELSVMLVRAGRVIDVASYSSKKVEVPDDEVVANFLREQYGETGDGGANIPDEVLVPVLPEGADGVAEWLTERRAENAAGRTRKCELLSPVRGPRRALLEMAVENARHAFEEKRRAADDIDDRLARIQLKLRLPTLPRRIECCDISHSAGKDTVGAVVALNNGVPDKKRYRTYHVKAVTEGDDYQAMYEVLGRRFRRGRAAAESSVASRAEASADEQTLMEATSNGVAAATVSDEADSHHSQVPESVDGHIEPQPDSDSRVDSKAQSESDGVPDSATGEWTLPDLFVVDGGRGQLQVALTAARDLGLHSLCIVGLAKEREQPAGEKLVDRVYLPGQKNPIPLRPNSPELFLLARARDEAHRFANRGRKKLGKRRTMTSALEHVRGVGPKTRVALLKSLGSVQALRAASDEQILAVPGVNRKHLAALREWLAGTDAPQEH